MVDKSKDTVTLMAVGDIGTHTEPADKLAELISPVLQQADLRFGQCEKTYTERPYTMYEPDAPRGPHGKRSTPIHPRLASIFKTSGMDVISLASNHTMDWGGEILMDTASLFRGWGKHVIGVGRNIDEARKPAIVEMNGVRIAFLAYCSVLAEGHEATKNRIGIAPVRANTYYQRGGDPHEDFHPGTPQRILTIPWDEDVKAMQDDIKKARQLADVVVMSIHWGIHHIPKHIATYQPIVAHAAIDAGADLILGHHPHCLKAVEVYKGKVCFYSIGNFMLPFPGRDKEHNSYWGFYYYKVDRTPGTTNRYPVENSMTMVAKAVFSRKGVDKVSFLPAFINSDCQPEQVKPGDSKFDEILDYTDWLSDEYPHKFRVERDEVVVE